jgi:hypothetical protein
MITETRREEQVLIRGKCFLYRQKAPFIPSGVSIYAALEYNEDTDKVRCHECGQWYLRLGKHVAAKHMKPKEYKDAHGLRRKAALCGLRESHRASLVSVREDVKKTLIKTAQIRLLGSRAGSAAQTDRLQYVEKYAELRNERGLCHAQIIDRLRAMVHRFSRAPTLREIRASGMCPGSILLKFNAPNMSAVFSLLDLPLSAGNRKYSSPILIELLRDFYVKFGHTPMKTDFRRKLLPNPSIFSYHFGTLGAAYKAAGLSGRYDVA